MGRLLYHVAKPEHYYCNDSNPCANAFVRAVKRAQDPAGMGQRLGDRELMMLGWMASGKLSLCRRSDPEMVAY
jgi:hypothetical protein